MYLTQSLPPEVSSLHVEQVKTSSQKIILTDARYATFISLIALVMALFSSGARAEDILEQSPSLGNYGSVIHHNGLDGATPGDLFFHTEVKNQSIIQNGDGDAHIVLPHKDSNGIIIELREPSLLKVHAELVAQRRRGTSLRAPLSSQERSVIEQQRTKTVDEQDFFLNKLNSHAARSPATTSTAAPIMRFYTALNAVVLRGRSLAEVQQLVASDPELTSRVKRIEPEKTVRAFLTESVELIKASEVWERVSPGGVTLSGLGVRIGIIDTGVDYTHRDLGGCFGPKCKVAGGYDFINLDPDPMDDHGHGTHCAATAAGDGSYIDSQGNTRILRGVAPDATIYAYKVLDSNGSSTDVTIIPALERCADPNQDLDFSDHLDVCSLSLGGDGDPNSLMSLAVDAAVRAGVVVVVAAGNSGGSPTAIGTPGSARLAITVAAACKPGSSSQYCSNGPIATFSSRGPVRGFPEVLKPDIAAPGVDICAAQFSSYQAAKACLDDAHIAISGTSMATPHVAGVAALLLQANPSADPASIKDAIMRTATDLGSSYLAQGSGMIDTQKAVEALQPSSGIVRVEGAPVSFAVIPTSSITEDSRTVTIRSLVDAPLTFDASFFTTQAGISGSVTPQSFTVAPGASETVKLHLQMDINKVPAQTRWNGLLRFSSPDGLVSAPVNGEILDRVNIDSKTLDLGLINGNAQSWKETRQVRLTNRLRDESVTYDIGLSCCGQYGRLSSRGVTVTVDKPVITIPPESSVMLTITFEGSGDAFTNGLYRGQITMSAPWEEVNIPVTFYKGWEFKFVFEESQEYIPITVWLHNKEEFLGSIGADPKWVVFRVSQPGPWQAEATFKATDLTAAVRDVLMFNFNQYATSTSNEVTFKVTDARQIVNFEELRMPNGEPPPGQLPIRGLRTISNTLGQVRHTRLSYGKHDAVKINTLAPEIVISSNFHGQEASRLITWSTFFKGDSRAGDLNVSHNPFVTKHISLAPHPNPAEATKLVARSCQWGICFLGLLRELTTIQSGHLGLWQASNNYNYYPEPEDPLARYVPITTLLAVPASHDYNPFLWERNAHTVFSGGLFFAPGGAYASIWTGNPLDFAETPANLVRAGFGDSIAFGAGPETNMGAITIERQTMKFRSPAWAYAPLTIGSGGVARGDEYSAWAPPRKLDNLRYELHFQDTIEKSGPVESTFDSSGTIVHELGQKAGTYRLDLTKTISFGEERAETKLSASFSVPVKEEGTAPRDLNPPALKYITLVGNDQVQHFFDPSIKNVLYFAIDPNQGCTKIWDLSWGWWRECADPPKDSLSSVRLQQSSNGQEWTELEPELTAVGDYKVELLTSGGSGMQYFRILAEDAAKNSLSYEFTIPVGAALVTPSPTPEVLPGQPLPKPVVKSRGSELIVSLPRLSLVDLSFEKKEVARQLRDLLMLPDDVVATYSDSTQFTAKCKIFPRNGKRTKTISAKLSHARGKSIKLQSRDWAPKGSISYKCRFVSSAPYGRVLGKDRTSPSVALRASRGRM
jgi:subtilisin family serine protease